MMYRENDMTSFISYMYLVSNRDYRISPRIEGPRADARVKG